MTKSPKVLLKNWTPYEETARHDPSTRFVPGPHQKVLTAKESIFVRFGKPKPLWKNT